MLKDLSVEVIHKFPPHIRHIHNIVPDKKIMVTTSKDNDPNQNILDRQRVSYMKPIVIGDQDRGRFGGFPLKGLLYATDSITDKNSIYLLKTNKENLNLKRLLKLMDLVYMLQKRNRDIMFQQR